MTNDLSNISLKFKYRGKSKLIIGNGNELLISHVGIVLLPTCDGTHIQVNNVLYVPQISRNLISISSRTIHNNYIVTFTNGHCVVKDK